MHIDAKLFILRLCPRCWQSKLHPRSQPSSYTSSKFAKDFKLSPAHADHIVYIKLIKPLNYEQPVYPAHKKAFHRPIAFQQCLLFAVDVVYSLYNISDSSISMYLPSWELCVCTREASHEAYCTQLSQLPAIISFIPCKIRLALCKILYCKRQPLVETWEQGRDTELEGSVDVGAFCSCFSTCVFLQRLHIHQPYQYTLL